MTLQEVARRIAVREDVPSILQAAVDGVRELLGTDAAFAAAARRDLNAYAMSATSGTTTPAFGELVIPPMRGLGGRVASLRRPMAVHDYLTDGSITRDFVDVVVHQEGLRGMACVPVITTLGVEALLYIAIRTPGFLADEQTLDTLTHVATFAGVAIDQTWGHARQRELCVLRERQRLASVLHDSVAQTLFAIGVDAKRTAEDSRPEQLAEALSSIASLATRAGQELRAALHRINEIPSRLSLAVALDAEAHAFEQLANLSVRVVTGGEPRSLSEVYETLICDTVHEAVRNAAKHASAQLVVVHLRYGDSDVGLTVQSDRPVTCAQERSLTPQGGLALLRVRAQAVRGDLELLLGEEGEAIVRLSLPDYTTTDLPATA